MKRGWIGWLAAVAGLAVLASCGAEADLEPAAERADYTIHLVRHAEKADGDDPVLTAAGELRAALLADRLSDAGIETVWSSDYQRTRQTAQPLADSLEIEVETYDASDLESLASTLKERGETALVVGHSNTTPFLAALLGGDAGDPINEAGEYDRLYVLTGFGNGVIETDIQRFGAPYEHAE